MSNECSAVAAFLSGMALKTADAGDGDTLYSLPFAALAGIRSRLDAWGLSVSSRSAVGETEGELRELTGGDRLYLYGNARAGTLCAVLGAGRLGGDPDAGTELYPDTVLYQCGNAILKNSMTYVLRLRDGSFILIDGGIETDEAALKGVLDVLDPLSAQHRVRAWILTHPHYDHVTVFKDSLTGFAPEAVYVNFPSLAENEKRDPAAVIQNRAVRERLGTYGGRVYKPYPGQSFTVGGLRFGVLYAQSEWTLSESMTTVNDASLVCRLGVPGGKTVLFLADVMAPAAGILEAFYGADTLKSDVVQIAHHSMYGPDFPFYEKIGPSACLWPVSASEYELYGKDLPRNGKLRALKIPHYLSCRGEAKLSL